MGACSVFSPSSNSADDDIPDKAAIQDFCARAAASPAFACCSESDKQLGEFIQRYSNADPEACKGDLEGQDVVIAGSPRRAFDAAHAEGCLVFYASQPCGFAADLDVREKAKAAGCDSVIAGLGDVGAVCTSSADCKDGLHCDRPIGSSPPTEGTCAAPVAPNGSCTNATTDGGSATTTIDLSGGDHPICGEGFGCSVAGRCIPLHTEGGQCTASGDCASGLTCHNGKCGHEAPSAEGGACQIDPDCDAGLYCTSQQTCAPRKAAGESCTTNPFTRAVHAECLGYCDADPLVGKGTCATFCGSK